MKIWIYDNATDMNNAIGCSLGDFCYRSDLLETSDWRFCKLYKLTTVGVSIVWTYVPPDGLAGVSGGGDMLKSTYDPDNNGTIAEAQLSLNYATHSNSLDHDGGAQNTAIAAKTTLTAVKADTDVADAISKKHANTLDHTQGTDTGTSAANFSINGNNAIKEGDSRLADARTPTAHSHAESDVTNLTTDLSAKAPVNNPTFTGTPAAPLAGQGTNTTQLATTSFVQQEVPYSKSLLNPFTTAQVGAQDTTLTFNMLANEVWAVDVYGTCSKASSATGLKFAIGAPSGAVVAGVQMGGAATLAAALIASLITAINTLGTALATGIGIQVAFELHFRIKNGGTPGLCKIQCATVTSNTLTIYAGTYMNFARCTEV